MKRTLTIVMVLLLASGCSKKAPSGVAKLKGQSSPIGAGQAIANQTWSDPDTLPPGTPVHQGKSAPQWGDQLQSPDAGTRTQASAALRDMGEAGYVELKKGLRNPAPDVRLSSLQGLYAPILLAHKDETLPMLRDMLQDPNPALREQAAIRMAWFAKENRAALPRLEQLAQNDPSPQVRSAAALSAGSIKDAASGRVNKD
jgi:hypothetical protein